MIVLTGPTCAGKSSVAAALLDVLAGDWVGIEADRAFPALSPDLAARATEPEARRTLAARLQRSALAWLGDEDGDDAGLPLRVVLDGALPGRGALRDGLVGDLVAHGAAFVGVTAAPTVRAERIVARRHPEPEWALAQDETVNAGLDLALTVDTSTSEPRADAVRIADALGLAMREGATSR